MNRMLPLSTGLAAAMLLVMSTSASAQILDGEYWEASLKGKTRVVLAPPGGPAGTPDGRTLLKGKLTKQTFYLLSTWDADSGTYGLDAWTDADGFWVLAEDAGVMAPFGEGYPDSKDAGFVLSVELNPTPAAAESLGAPAAVLIDMQGLIALKIKEVKGGSGTPGANEVQRLEAGGATGGSFTLSFGGVATAGLAFDVPPATLQAALQGLPTIGAGNILVQGAGPFLLTFSGSLGLMDVEQILVDSDSTSGGTGVDVTVNSEGMEAGLPLLKSSSFDLAGVGSTMVSLDFSGEGNVMTGNPKVSARRITEDRLPFSVSEAR